MLLDDREQVAEQAEMKLAERELAAIAARGAIGKQRAVGAGGRG
ncbi:MAG: hypothetical protein M0T77_01715 [Actinomycetota bacterium]|nr:hypothetical protein [Actinomycetota bacterium]